MRTGVRATLPLLMACALLGACTSAGSMSSSSTPSAASASTAFASSAAPSASSALSAGAMPVAEVLTPVLGSVPDPPIPVTGTDGRTYLAYELLLTNATSTPVTIHSVRVVDAAGAAVQEFTGGELVEHARLVGAAPAPTTVTLQGGQLGVIWLGPSVEAGAAPPEQLDHVITMTFAQAPNPLVPADVTETIARTTVSAVPAPVVRSPLDGRRWLNGNGCCDTVTAHRGALNPVNGRFDLAERFAIDWVRLDADNRIYTGDRTQLSSYPFYGVPVHAVADGEVVAVSDDLPDQPPGDDPPLGSLRIDQYGGNYVVQRFSQDGHDYYAYYAHLKPGTANAAVQVGQRIAAGDQVGELGNSGNTDGPHLHFHVMDGPNPLASSGVPYVFDAMTMVGRAADPAALDAAATQGAPLQLEAGGPTGERTDELPLWMDVVDLSAGR